MYKAVVVGSGPAGLACVGNILESIASSDRILWIDPKFEAGRLSTYHRVPSNTKAALFSKFARECASFKCEESPTLIELETQMNPQSTCQLQYAANLCTDLTKALRTNAQISSLTNSVKELTYSEANRAWSLHLADGVVVSAEKVFLTTGAHPKSLDTLPANSEEIHLDVALNPEALAARVSPADTVAVYGSSHSAMLVLMNLLNNPEVKHIVNVYRQPMKFAEFPDPINRPDVILHDNTGLKGDVATWVRGWHEQTGLLFEGRLTRICTAEHPEAQIDCTKVICAVGYECNALPIISGVPDFSIATLDYDAKGQFSSQGALISGLYGFGIAFPERVVDLDGTPELAVGMWKFMRHVKKSIAAIPF